MSWMQIAAALGAAAVVGYPLLKPLVAFVAAARPKVASYEQAIADLASVRGRLVSTDRLQDSERKAIDVLTLALVDSSDL